MIPICNIYMIDVLWYDIINFICIYKYIIIETFKKKIMIVLTLLFLISFIHSVSTLSCLLPVKFFWLSMKVPAIKVQLALWNLTHILTKTVHYQEAVFQTHSVYTRKHLYF